MSSYGYLYVRVHPAYDIHDACKMGMTNTTLPDREGQYVTGEVTKGYFQLVIEMSPTYTRIIETCLKNHFSTLGYHVQLSGGTEFYKRDIIDLIVPYLEQTNLVFRVLSIEDMETMERAERFKSIIVKLKTILKKSPLKIRPRPKPSTHYIPRPDQQIIIDDSVKYFETHDKGLLILMCGVGKSLISLWISQRLHSHTLLIGVPNKLLCNQWSAVLRQFFPQTPILSVLGGVSETDIQHFLQKYPEHCLVLTTYSSSHKVNATTRRISFTFQMKILDEAHHLTSYRIRTERTASFVEILQVPSVKQLGLTATPKQLDDGSSDNDTIISNDNITHFGEIIHHKNLLWAIRNNVITDYVIQTIVTSEEKLEPLLDGFLITVENDKRLLLSAYASLKSIHDGHSHHLLIYSNSKENSLKIFRFIRLLLEHHYFIIPEIYYSAYHSDMNNRDLKDKIKQFEDATYGIISCVYCLGEGWDFPLLDGVVFAENMSSIIRILQSALRASRKNKNEPNKISKIILPILNRDDWLENNDNPDLKKVKEVIYYMGLEDETIAHKIRVSRVEVEKSPSKQPARVAGEYSGDFGEYDPELTHKLRLRTTARNALRTSYEKVRKILVEKNVKNKEEYVELCRVDNRLPSDPEIVFKIYCSGDFDWFEFLSIPRTEGIYYDFVTCKTKVDHYLGQHFYLRSFYLDITALCSELCKLDDKFPPNGLWKEYYKIKELREVIAAAEPKKRKTSAFI